MSTLAYYPGCSLRSTARDYHTSLMVIARTLQQDLEEIPDWLCCGASAAHAIDPALATALAGDTLAKAQTQGHQQVLAPCAMCYSRLASAVLKLKNPSARASLEEALKLQPESLREMKVLNVLDWLASLGSECLQKPVKKSLSSWRLACYYGCLLVRPQTVTQAAEAEFPHTMEDLVSLTGAQPVTWSKATACCGASFSLGDKPTVFRLGRAIVEEARQAGAQALVVACPMCHTNLDMRQSEYQPRNQQIPVLYITQLLGLAYGFSPAEIGLNHHLIDTKALLKRLQDGGATHG